MNIIESFYQDHPVAFVVTDLQGVVRQFNPWAGQLLDISQDQYIQEYFFEDDAQILIQTLQSCDPIYGQVLRFEGAQDQILHLRCTAVVRDGCFTWMLENVADLISTKEKLAGLKIIPREFGHEINNFLTVIGSAAEAIFSDTQESISREDAESILIMTNRAAVLTRRFMTLGRKSLLASEIVDLQELLDVEWAHFERVVGTSISLNRTEESTHVYASEFLLRNILVHLGLCFRDKTVNAHLDVLMVNYQFASKILGHPSGEYIVLTICEEGFEYSLSDLLDTTHYVKNENPNLQGTWEGLIRCRGGVFEKRNDQGASSLSIFIPWIRAPKLK